MSNPIDVTGISKVALLRALWEGTREASRLVGMPPPRELLEIDFQHALERAEHPVSKGLYRFDYVFGRPIKVRIEDAGPSTVLHDAWLYDRDAGGAGTCEAIVDTLRAGKVQQ